MPIRVLNHIPDDADLRAQWNALVLQTRSPQVFYTWEWATAVQRAYSATLHPILCLGYDDSDRLSGVAALASDAMRRISFLCATTGDYCDFIVSEHNAADFTSEVIKTLRESGYGEIVLTNFPEDSPAFAALGGASRKYGYRMYARTAYLCAQVRLADLRESISARTPLPRQKMVRRSLRAMGAATAPVTVSNSDWETVNSLLPEFFRAHVARFAFTDRISNLVRPERREFLSELARLLSAAGWLCFTRMDADLRSIAWNYGFKFRATWFWYQPTFVNDLEKYSPGFVLLYKLTETAAQDDSLDVVDLGLGAEAYKEAFANASRRTMYVTLHRSRLKHWREIARYQAATVITRWPWAEKMARTLRARLVALRRRVRTNGVKSTLGWVLLRMRGWIFLQQEVFFYELSNPNPALLSVEGVCLTKIDLNTLAVAAMQNPDDEGTLAYLLRCAQRLRTDAESTGFALANAAGELLHFTWAGPFETFHWSELNSGLPSPAPGSVILFDSWTPVSQRGRGYYAPTLALAVAALRQEGRRSWGFSAATNVSSVRGLEKAGFQRSFSVFRYRLLWWQRVVQRNVTPSSFS